MSAKKTHGKDKIVPEYESLFSKEPKELLSSKGDFWDNLFLLQPNCFLLQSLVKDAIKGKRRQDAIQLLFSQCSVALKDDSNVRIANSLLTLIVMSRTVLFRRKKSSQSVDAVDVLIGRADLDVKLEILRGRLCQLLLSDCTQTGIKSLILDFLLVLVTSQDDLQSNPFILHLMSDHLFDAFINVTVTLQSRQVLGFRALLLLTLLVNYKQGLECEVNPYIVKLSIVHNEVALNGFAHVICSEFYEFNKKYEEKNEIPKSGGIFSSLTHMMGNMFVADDDAETPGRVTCNRGGLIKPSNALLLALYHAIHLNRNFITLLTNFAAEPLTEDTNNADTVDGTVSPSPSVSSNAPSNLLVSFLEFCSIVMLNTKDEGSCKTSRLCFVILTCITEDQCANAIMHDNNIAFRVQLHRTPMRHRKVVSELSKPCQSLSHTVLDLMVEFIQSNLRKSFPLHLHSLALGIIVRIICYQKKCNLRVECHWTEVWSALINLLKFIINHESDLLKSKHDIFSLALTCINILNLFITFGDTFLPSAEVYDQLYYEIIRMHIVFDNLYQLSVRYSSLDSSLFKESSQKIVHSLINIRSIINHFNPKIDSWSSKNEVESLTEQDVLEVVRNNYDSLVLKLEEGLDSYYSYSSQEPDEFIFFQEMLTQVILETRESSASGLKDQDYTAKHAVLLKDVMSKEQEAFCNNSSNGPASL